MNDLNEAAIERRTPVSIAAEALVLCALAFGISWFGFRALPAALTDWQFVDVWFDSDLPRVVQNLSVREHGHEGLFKHPIFSILLWPPTVLLIKITGDVLTAVALLLALNASIGTFAFWALLRRGGLVFPDRVLGTLLMLSSAGFVFWMTVPSTYPFSMTTILVALHMVYWIDIRDPLRRTIAMIFGGIAALSITTTNFLIAVSGALAATGVLDALRPAAIWAAFRRNFARGVLYLGGAFVLTAVIAVIQDRIFGDAGLFFNVLSLMNEKQFIGQAQANPIQWRPALVLIAPAIAPVHEIVESLSTPGKFVLRMYNYGFGGTLHIAAALSWVALLAAGLIQIVRSYANGPLTPTWERSLAWQRLQVSALVSLILFLVFYLVYGAEVFLYAAQIGPVLLVIAANPLARRGATFARLLVCTVIVLAGAHNAMEFARAIQSVDTIVARGQ
ncbi:hypothetical protein ACXYMO_15320 [Arenibacterium sp. CAU 1754]